MHLELTEEQVRELRLALHDLRDRMERELSRTEQSEYRQSLRQSADRLDEIVRKLDLSADQASAYA